MGIVFRQSIKTSIVTLAGALLGAFVTWLSIKYFTQQQLGLTRTITGWAVQASTFVFIGTNNLLQVYIHRYAGNLKKMRMLLTVCLLIPLVCIILASVVYFLSRGAVLNNLQPQDAALMQRYYMWLPVNTALFAAMVWLEVFLGSQMKVAAPAFIREVVLRLANIVIIFLFAYGCINFTWLLSGTVLMYIIPVFSFFLLALRIREFGFSFRLNHFAKSEYMDMTRFSWYHFLLAVTISLMASLDILTLPYYDPNGLSSVAVYSVALVLISFLQIPYKAMQSSTFAVLAQAITNSDTHKAKDIFNRSSINILIATTAVALVIYCNLDNALGIMHKDGYAEIIPVFSILLIGKFIDLSTGMNDAVLTITNYYKFNVYISSALIVILFLLIRHFVPLYGVLGAAGSSAAALILFNIAKCIFVWKKLGMQPFSSGTLLVLLSAVPALAAGYFLPHFFSQVRHVYVHAFLDTILRSIVIITAYVLMLLWLKPSKDLEEYISQIKKNKRLF